MSLVTVTVDRNKATVIIKNVPAEVCKNCGEEYVDKKTTSSLLKITERIADAGSLVDIVHYKAA